MTLHLASLNDTTPFDPLRRNLKECIPNGVGPPSLAPQYSNETQSTYLSNRSDDDSGNLGSDISDDTGVSSYATYV